MLSGRLKQYYAASDAHPAGNPFPGVTGYRTPRSGDTIRRSPGQGGPPQFPPPLWIRSAPHTPGSSSRLHFQTLHRFHGLRPDLERARHSLVPTECRLSNDAAGFALRYGPHPRFPFTGPLTLGSGPARFQAKPPACYRASWQLPGPDFHRQATTSLRTQGSAMAYVTVPPPVLLGARENLTEDPAASCIQNGICPAQRLRRSQSSFG